MSEPDPARSISTPWVDAPDDHECSDEDDYERDLKDHSRRLDRLDATLQKVIVLAAERADLDFQNLEKAAALHYCREDIRRLIREAVLDLRDALADLEGRCDQPDWDDCDSLPESYYAYDWARHALHDILTRSGYDCALNCEPDGRFIYRYSPPKRVSLDDLLARMITGPDGEVTIRNPETEPRREIEIVIEDNELARLRGALRLLRAYRDPFPPTIVPAQVRGQSYLGLSVDENNRALTREGFQECVRFGGSKLAWNLAKHFMESKGELVKHEHFPEIWESAGCSDQPGKKLIADEISRLRTTLSPLGINIESVRSIGYRLVEVDDDTSGNSPVLFR